MSETQTIGALDFDPDRLRPVLENDFGAARGFRLERISGGQSCPTYFVDWGTSRMVLRKQPTGPILKGAHAVDREYRVLVALHGTDIPVPRPLLFHADPDTIGTPFYLMERINGRVLTDTTLAALPAAQRAPVWMAVADTLARLHKKRPQDIGLGDFGRPGNYFQRQLDRWNRQYRASPSGPIPEIETVYDWLVAHLPADDGRVALCHGDFRLGNLMFHPDRPQVVAVLDWELSTLGHPLADLGFCCMPWHSTADEYGGLLGTDLSAMALPSETDFVARYQSHFDAPVPLLPFHKAFAMFRFAVIFVGIADRAKAGSAADPKAERLAPLARKFAHRALEVVEGRRHVIQA